MAIAAAVFVDGQLSQKKSEARIAEALSQIANLAKQSGRQADAMSRELDEAQDQTLSLKQQAQALSQSARSAEQQLELQKSLALEGERPIIIPSIQSGVLNSYTNNIDVSISLSNGGSSPGFIEEFSVSDAGSRRAKTFFDDEQSEEGPNQEDMIRDTFSTFTSKIENNARGCTRGGVIVPPGGAFNVVCVFMNPYPIYKKGQNATSYILPGFLKIYMEYKYRDARGRKWAAGSLFTAPPELGGPWRAAKTFDRNISK